MQTNKVYNLGDILDTTNCRYFVQCSLVLQGHFAGRVIHWLQDENLNDVILWDHELDKLSPKLYTDEFDVG